MLKDPKGQLRPADMIGCAVTVAKIATGEIEEQLETGIVPARAAGGKIGGRERAAKLSKSRRVEIAKIAAAVRWGNPSWLSVPEM